MAAPADDIRKLLNFEDAIETATRAILTAAGITDTFLPTGSADLPASHLEVLFSTGESMNQNTRDNGEKVYDFFDGLLRLRIASVRSEQQASLLAGVRSLHEEFAATARAALQERLDPYATLLPWYEVKMIRPLPTQRGLDGQFFEDFTELSFQFQFGIREDAWPA